MITNLRRAGTSFGLLLVLAMLGLGVVWAGSEAANIDQCANGPLSAPVSCTGAAWQNGNIHPGNSHYTEGDVVPFRQILTGLAPGTTYSVTIRWQFLNSDKHAYDYITTYNTTEASADPCSDVAGAVCGSPSPGTIPPDPTLLAGCNLIKGTAVPQIAGVFTLFGGAIIGVGPYSQLGCGSVNASQSIVVTFTATQATEVLAWGGHVGRQADWGIGQGATGISGSPYHMFQDSCSFGCGAQERSMRAAPPGTATAVTVSSMSAKTEDGGVNLAVVILGGFGIVALGGLVVFAVSRR